MSRFYFWLFLVLLFLLRFLSSRVSYLDGTILRISGKVLSEPSNTSNNQIVRLSGIVIFIPNFYPVHYGDNIVLEGKIYSGVIKNPKVISLNEGTNFLVKLRRNILNFFFQNLPEDDAALVSGVTLGSKAYLNREFWNKLLKSGTAHVVVASGANVTFIASFLVTFLITFLKRRQTIFLLLIGIWSYCFMAGMEAPIVRAGITSSLVFTAQALGKPSWQWESLFLTGLVMLIIRPDWIFDVGFILSFASTVSLILFTKKIDKKLAFLPSPLKESFSTSFAAQIGVSPILYIAFGYINILSPLYNALVLWTIPYIMILGLLGGFGGLLFAPLGRLFLFLTYPLTGWFIGIVKLSG